MNAEAISGIYLKTLVLIAHSQYEAGGRVIIEAMSQKRPVIATPVGFASDLIRNWHNGFLVEYGDIDLLAMRMAHFIRQPILSNALGNAAKETISYIKQSWNYYERIQDIYNKIIYNFQAPVTLKKDEYKTANTDYFSLGMISTYPYAYNRFFENHGSYIEYPCANSTEELSLVHNAIISQTDSQISSYLHVRYYSELNKAKLWNSFADTEVHLGYIRYDKALSSSFSQVVIKPIEVNKKELYMRIPVLPLLEDCFIYSRHDIMINLLYSFNSSNIPEITGLKPVSYCSNNTLSLYAMFNEILTQPLLHTWPQGLIALHENEKMFIRKVITNVAYANGLYGINYGKSLTGRVAIQQNEIYLLMPCTDIYYGEMGYDIGLYLYDILKYDEKLSSQTLLGIVNQAANLYKQSPKYLLTWTLLVAFERLMASNVMLLENEIKANMRIWVMLKQIICDQ